MNMKLKSSRLRFRVEVFGAGGGRVMMSYKFFSWTKSLDFFFSFSAPVPFFDTNNRVNALPR